MHATVETSHLRKAIWLPLLSALAGPALLTLVFMSALDAARHDASTGLLLSLLGIPVLPLVHVFITSRLLPRHAWRRHWPALLISSVLLGFGFLYCAMLVVFNTVGS